MQSFRSTTSTVGIEIASGGTVIEKLAADARPRRTPAADAPQPVRARRAHRGTPHRRRRSGDRRSRATATIPPLPRRRILRVGGADLYLDGALLGLGRTVHVDRLPAADADGAAARARDYDLVIFDGVTPSAAPQAGRFLYFDPQGPGNPFAAAREARPVRDPVLDPASLHREHPLLRQLDLADVNVAEAHRLALAPGDVALAASFDVPLIVVARAPRPARRRAGLRPAPFGPPDAPGVPAADRQRARLGGPRRCADAGARRRSGRHRARRARVGHGARAGPWRSAGACSAPPDSARATFSPPASAAGR